MPPFYRTYDCRDSCRSHGRATCRPHPRTLHLSGPADAGEAEPTGGSDGGDAVEKPIVERCVFGAGWCRGAGLRRYRAGAVACRVGGGRRCHRRFSSGSLEPLRQVRGTVLLPAPGPQRMSGGWAPRQQPRRQWRLRSHSQPGRRGRRRARGLALLRQVRGTVLLPAPGPQRMSGRRAPWHQAERQWRLRPTHGSRVEFPRTRYPDALALLRQVCGTVVPPAPGYRRVSGRRAPRQQPGRRRRLRTLPVVRPEGCCSSGKLFR
jgi:hypothetical protein